MKNGARALICLSLLASCATPVPARVTRVDIAPGLSFALPDAAELGRTVAAVQMVTAHRDGDSFVFEGRVAADADGLTLAGTDALGRRAMTIRWQGRTLAVDSAAWLPQAVRAENVLADLILLYWPGEAVRRGLAGSGATLDDGDGRRVVRRDGTAVVVIDGAPAPWTGTARLANLAWGYELEIRSVAVAP